MKPRLVAAVTATAVVGLVAIVLGVAVLLGWSAAWLVSMAGDRVVFWLAVAALVVGVAGLWGLCYQDALARSRKPRA